MTAGGRIILEYDEAQRDHVMHLARVRHAVSIKPEERTSAGYCRITLERTE